MSETIGFIGLGNMGLPMARNLLEAGHALRVFNRTASKATPLVSAGATGTSSPREAAEGAAIVITMLSDDAAVEQVTLGDQGLLTGIAKDAVHVSMSTLSPALSRRLGEAHARAGSAYVASPVFGRPDAAAAKKLWICASGPKEALARVEPVLASLGQGVFPLGEDCGAANVFKLSGNFLIAAALEAMSEALALVEKNGIDREKAVEIWASTLFGGPIYEGYGAAIAAHRYQPAGFRLALGRKDLNLALDAALGSGVPMPVASLVRDRLTAAIGRGRADLDWSALGLSAAEEAGLTLG